MSWIVQTLLNNRHDIKSTGDINSDDYNDLLAVERAIDELYRAGLLSEDDKEILYSFGAAKQELPKIERHTLSKRRDAISTRIAYYLGGYFTDEGYLNYVENKYRLSDKQVALLREYIKSEYKHRIIRKPLNAKEHIEV